MKTYRILRTETSVSEYWMDVTADSEEQAKARAGVGHIERVREKEHVNLFDENHSSNTEVVILP